MGGIFGRTSTRAVWVWTSVAGATVTIERVNPSFTVTGTAGAAGLVQLERVIGFPGRAANLHVRAAGYQPLDIIGVTILDGNQELRLGAGGLPALVKVSVPTPPTSRLPALRVNGPWFETIDGTPWSQRATTDFRLLQRVLNGEDIDPILTQRRDLGFNQVRVLGMCELMFTLHPQDYADYDAKLAAFCQKLQAFGLRMEFTVFADATRVMPSHAEQLAFAEQVYAALRPFTHMVFCELVNENDQVVNTIRAGEFPKPQGLIWCRGSLGADKHPGVEPLGDYGTLHPARPSDWVRKAAHNPMEDIADRFKIPATCNEMARPDQGRGPIPSDHFDAGAGGALLHCGTTYHCPQGKNSELFTGDDLACAQAYVRGVLAVPLHYRYGQYAAGHLSNSPLVHHPVHRGKPGDLDYVQDPQVWASQTYARIVGDTACVVVLQKTPDWRLVLNDGWHVVRETESVLELER